MLEALIIEGNWEGNLRRGAQRTRRTAKFAKETLMELVIPHYDRRLSNIEVEGTICLREMDPLLLKLEAILKKSGPKDSFGG